MKKASLLKLLVVLPVVVLAAMTAVEARQQQQPPQQAGGAPQQEGKNILVLKGMPRQQLIQTMRDWSAALGVECSYCHQAPFDTETPRKHVARLMVRDYVNGAKHADGSAVSCKDCHQGAPTPLRTQPFESWKMEGGLQVIKREQVREVMGAFTKALGVNCAYCHKEGDFAAETPRKQVSRYMMTEYSGKMTKADGSMMSCNDCHQGNALPLVKLPYPARAPQQRPAGAPANAPAGGQAPAGEKKP